MAFPGWSPRVGTFALSDVAYDESGIGAPEVALYDMPAQNFGIPMLQGEYYAILIRDFSSATHVTLEQSGDVPVGTRSLQLLADRSFGPPDVFVNGSRISLQRLNDVDYYISRYGGDVSAFAGGFAALVLDNREGTMAVDDISFSPTAVPEPSLVALALTIGAATRARRVL